MKALTNQLQKMPDEALKALYDSMSIKCTKLMVMQDMDISIDVIPKIERLKEKYSYVETELTNRGIGNRTQIRELNVEPLKEKKEAWAQTVINELSIGAK